MVNLPQAGANVSVKSEAPLTGVSGFIHGITSTVRDVVNAVAGEPGDVTNDINRSVRPLLDAMDSAGRAMQGIGALGMAVQGADPGSASYSLMRTGKGLSDSASTLKKRGDSVVKASKDLTQDWNEFDSMKEGLSNYDEARKKELYQKIKKEIDAAGGHVVIPFEGPKPARKPGAYRRRE
jgi:hypothetical protein